MIRIKTYVFDVSFSIEKYHFYKWNKYNLKWKLWFNRSQKKLSWVGGSIMVDYYYFWTRLEWFFMTIYLSFVLNDIASIFHYFTKSKVLKYLLRLFLFHVNYMIGLISLYRKFYLSLIKIIYCQACMILKLVFIINESRWSIR